MTIQEQVLKEIVQDIYKINTEQGVINAIIDSNKDKVHIGKLLNPENHIHGTFQGQIVSIEKKPLLMMFKAINEILKG